MTAHEATGLCARLDSFDLPERLKALRELAAASAGAQPPATELVNMHAHSFFSYNTDGCSPAHIAWEAFGRGLYAAGLCDFDVLDGLEEFLLAGRILGLRVTVNLETRAFLKEYAAVDINSPGEPGITYIMGLGFSRVPGNGSHAARILQNYREQAAERNRALVGRINAALSRVALDYERDVMPLSPAGCPTERHIVRAYRLKAEQAFGQAPARHEFWARIMKAKPAAVAQWAVSLPVLEEKIRAALVKQGGIGYERPTERSFPRVDDFVAWVLDGRALPAVTWLDGTSAGEADMVAMMECLRAKGACALNIIPDRNHNIADPAGRALKLKKLAEVVQAAEALQFPVNIGTELNKAGQPFVDNTLGEALRPYHALFLRGARIMVGQTLLARYTPMAYVGMAAQAEFGRNTRQKNDCFEAVGRLAPMTEPLAARLESLGPDRAYAVIRDSLRHGAWAV